MLKTPIFEKVHKLPVKKRFWPFFAHIIECDKAEGKKYDGSQSILSITVEIKKINSLGPKRLLKTQISGKKGKLSSEEKILAYFSRFIECDKSQGRSVREQKVL